MQINYRYKELQYMHKLTMLTKVYESMVRFSYQNSTFPLVF